MPPNHTPTVNSSQYPPAVLVIVTGDRYANAQTWSPAINHALFEEHTIECPIFLLHGACTGIDTLAADLGENLGYSKMPLPAQWKKHGRPAGPRRNSAMVHLGQIYRDHGWYVVVCAFHDSLDTSAGTADMVRKSRAAGLPVRVFTSKREV